MDRRGLLVKSKCGFQGFWFGVKGMVEENIQTKIR